LPGLFAWAVIDRPFRTRPPQHLAREPAAAGHRVFRVSGNFIDPAEPGFQVEPNRTTCEAKWGHGCRTGIVTLDRRAAGKGGLNGNGRPEWMNAGERIPCIVDTA
jgi:hypothetical protein